MPGSFPYFPGSPASVPDFLQVVLVAQRVHGMPEPAVYVFRKLALASERLHRYPLPDSRVTVDVVKHLGREDEKTAIDHSSVSLRFFLEAANQIVVQYHGAEATRRLDGNQRSKYIPFLVKFDEPGQITLRNAFSICHAKRLVAEIGLDAFQTPAGHGVLARIHQSHLPGFNVVLMDFHLVTSHIEGDVRHVQKVIGEVLLDDISLVAEADDEIAYIVSRVDLHDVPQDWLATNFYHRLRPEVGFFTYAGAQPTREY